MEIPATLRETILHGQSVTLRPPVPDDGSSLFAPTHGDEERDSVWTYMAYGPWPSEEAFTEWVAERAASSDPLWFTVERDSTPVGMATMCNYAPEHRRVELGHIWYIPSAQRTVVNTEATYLLLKHSFESYQARRVEWKADARNERSRAAALRLGFSFEGIFRQHMIVKGENRDTVWFAMTDGDWPEVEARLRAKLA
ncbi:MAG TPA: GNAT family protein [Acidimicrobiia bacterium]|nr:GNAT family protein [Acidimicrobiia bacterium]